MTTTPLISLSNISFSYGDRKVLSAVDLNINKGDYLAIIGPNGAGKTTLLKLIFGVLAPQNGEIQIFGTPIHHFKNWWRIGYVPQKTALLDANFPATVYEAVLMGRYAKKGLFRMTDKTDQHKTEEALARVGLLHLRNRMVSDLSGGQTQRVFIARALATEPELLILDEPTAGVDQKSQDELYALLRKLNKEDHVTIALVSHDIEAIARETTQLAYIDQTLTYHESSLSFIEHDLARVLSHGHDH